MAHHGNTESNCPPNVLIGAARFPEDGRMPDAVRRRETDATASEAGDGDLRRDSPSEQLEAPELHPGAPGEQESAEGGAHGAGRGAASRCERALLVVDDEQSLRDVVSQVLSDEGYEVDAVDRARRRFSPSTEGRMSW